MAEAQRSARPVGLHLKHPDPVVLQGTRKATVRNDRRWAGPETLTSCVVTSWSWLAAMLVVPTASEQGGTVSEWLDCEWPDCERIERPGADSKEGSDGLPGKLGWLWPAL